VAYLLVVLHGESDADPESGERRASAKESSAVVQHLGAGWSGEHDCGRSLVFVVEWSCSWTGSVVKKSKKRFRSAESLEYKGILERYEEGAGLKYGETGHAEVPRTIPSCHDVAR
jgi:hypothetical protein